MTLELSSNKSESAKFPMVPNIPQRQRKRLRAMLDWMLYLLGCNRVVELNINHERSSQEGNPKDPAYMRSMPGP